MPYVHVITQIKHLFMIYAMNMVFMSLMKLILKHMEHGVNFLLRLRYCLGTVPVTIPGGFI